MTTSPGRPAGAAAETRAGMAPEELEDMRSTVAGFLGDAAPIARVREMMAGTTGYDEALWRRLQGELGLAGALIPERLGGLGLTFADGAVLLGEFARRLTPVPMAELLVATTLLSACHTDAADAHLAEIAETATVVAIAGADAAAPLPIAEAGPGGWSLSGRCRYVPFGHVADLLLLSAQTSDGPALFALRADATGLRRPAHGGLDATRPLADIELGGAAAQRVSAASGGGAGAELLRDLVLVAQAVEAAAGAAAALELTVAYLKVREQFGRPIGSFQALKHRCADHAVTVAGARATAHHAAITASAATSGGTADDPLPVIASLAKAVCADAYMTVAADAIQLHGGIGFTFEHDIHLYFKRAKATQHLYGHPAVLRSRLATAVLDYPGALRTERAHAPAW